MEGRLNYISLLRVMAMFLIVFFHSLCFYTGAWWRFKVDIIRGWEIIADSVVKIGLALFVFIAGFLYGYLYFEKGKYKDCYTFMIGKFRRLLIPYMLWGITCVFLPLGYEWGALFTGIAHLWFLLVLFELFIIIAFITRLGLLIKDACGMRSCFLFDLLLFMSSFTLVYIWRSCCNHHFILGIESTLYYLPLMLSGYYISKYRAHRCVSVELSVVGLLMGVICLLFISMVDYNLLFSTQVILIIIAFSLIMLTKKVCSQCKLGTFVAKLDKFSMGVYIFNQLVIFGILSIQPMNRYLSSLTMMGPFLIFVFSFAFSYLLSYWFFRIKYLSWMVGL